MARSRNIILEEGSLGGQPLEKGGCIPGTINSWLGPLSLGFTFDPKDFRPLFFSPQTE